MTDIKTLMEQTNGHRGFIGSYTDKLPYLSLTEATAQLPCIILEQQISFINDRKVTSGILSEAAILNLNESAFGTLKDKIEAFFERILRWVRSIIAKLKVQMDRMKMTGDELYAKYADKLSNDSEYAGLEFNGYKFAAGRRYIEALRDSFDANIENVVKSGLQHAGVSNVILPNEFTRTLQNLARKIPEGKTLEREKYEEITNDIDNITDLSRGERVAAMVSVLAGTNLTEDWEDEVHQKCWGEKGPIRYGTDMFYPKMIGQILRGNELKSCMEGYEHLEQSIKGYRSRLKGELAQVWDEFYQNTDSINLPGNLSVQALINRYYNVYISCVNDALTASAQMKHLKVAFYTDMHHQAVSMLVRLVNKGNGPDSDKGKED